MRNLLKRRGSTFRKGGAKSFAVLFPKVDFWVYLFLKGKVEPNLSLNYLKINNKFLFNLVQFFKKVKIIYLDPLYLLEKGKTKNLLLGKVEQNFWLHLF
jgi:hypothetical protein